MGRNFRATNKSPDAVYEELRTLGCNQRRVLIELAYGDAESAVELTMRLLEDPSNDATGGRQYYTAITRALRGLEARDMIFYSYDDDLKRKTVALTRRGERFSKRLAGDVHWDGEHPE